MTFSRSTGASAALAFALISVGGAAIAQGAPPAIWENHPICRASRSPGWSKGDCNFPRQTCGRLSQCCIGLRHDAFFKIRDQSKLAISARDRGGKARRMSSGIVVGRYIFF